ncbi:protein of unknown function [Paenibacillus sp. yr247]|uniref:GIY-YIG nuclease family protein n=1 Tax=Paenibacillus sp. yr247 TaxID=1761880 RepID=UPI0008855481|nr:GIY-YIG nuclease family protein [Paenibacillus sp. yr247]SDO53714.1 protein of unknown function [Paenibacillus sp. yr247]
MNRGSSIRIYLADKSVTGIRHAEVVNWTGQAVACPRSKISELTKWPESSRPGVYFLFGYNDVTSRIQAYIGEAENVLVRIEEHLKLKEFWNEVVFFTSKDDNLTKSHVKFLESKIIEFCREANRYEILNGNQSSPSKLPRSDVDAMEEFLDNLTILLGVLGHKVLEKLTRTKTEFDSNNIYTISIKGIDARAKLTNEGIVVLKGSQISQEVRTSLSNGYLELRNRLVENGIIIKDNASLKFSEDYLFSSPSSAAAIIVGYSINGKDIWKNSNKISINELEQKMNGI